MSCPFAGLPLDAVSSILANCESEPYDLLHIAECSRWLREAVNCPRRWQRMLAERHASVIAALFDGSAPVAAGLTAKQHFFAFDADWLNLARERAPHRLLLRMSTQCTKSWPMYYGVPPRQLTEVASRRALRQFLHDLIGLHDNLEVPHCVCDAAHFAARHPGAEVLLYDAARRADATADFDAASHSELARHMLRELVVPGLECLPIPLRLARRTQRRACLDAWHGPSHCCTQFTQLFNVDGRSELLVELVDWLPCVVFCRLCLRWARERAYLSVLLMAPVLLCSVAITLFALPAMLLAACSEEGFRLGKNGHGPAHVV